MTPELLLDGRVSLYSGDCIEILGTLPDNSIDAAVMDPPYHLTSIVKRFGAANAAPAKVGATGAFARASRGFMGKQWDGGDIAFRPETWALVLRALKPGGHLVAFSGTRTYHRMACAIEDAGFEIRDMLQWLYGSGFPKSHNVAKAIDETMFRRWLDADHERRAAYDSEMHAAKSIKRAERRAVAVDEIEQRWRKAAGCARGVIGRERLPNDIRNGALAARDALDTETGARPAYERDITESATDEARAAEGWGTAFKPALEPICFARKPLIGTVAENFMQHGTGAIHIDACRVGSGEVRQSSTGGLAHKASPVYGAFANDEVKAISTTEGRWPANVIHDGSQEVVGLFPETPGQQRSVGPNNGAKTSVNVFGNYGPREHFEPRNDSGSAARFFKSCPFTEDDLSWTRSPAPVADECLSLSSEAAVTVLSLAVEASTPRLVLQKQSFQAPSTTVTESELKTIATLVTELIQSLEKRSWQGLRPEKLTLSCILASIAADPTPTGTITITISLQISNGSAELVTFNTIATNLVPGESALESRLFYTAKADVDERLGSKHPTVKPTDLMQWLVRSVTPKGGTVLDCFAGTGTTGEAAWREGMRAILIEREPEYQEDIRRRMSLVLGGPEERHRVAMKPREKSVDDLPLFGGEGVKHGGGIATDKFTDH